MAKNEVRYCCGHGIVIKDLVGPMKERDRKIEWMEMNMLCPECYKEKLKSDKAAEPRKARISLHHKYGNILLIEVKGQLDESESALRALGYHWRRPAYNGVPSKRRLEPFLTKDLEFRTKEEADRMVADVTAELTALGYECILEFNRMDLFRIQRCCEAIEKVADALDANPRPPESALRVRIREIEDDARGKWNGTIYGNKGSYLIYVRGAEHPAEDAEVEEHLKQDRLLAAWKKRHPMFR